MNLELKDTLRSFPENPQDGSKRFYRELYIPAASVRPVG